MNHTTFSTLPLGTKFTCQGETFTKIALSMAADGRRYGTVFFAGTLVEVPEGEPLKSQREDQQETDIQSEQDLTASVRDEEATGPILDRNSQVCFHKAW